MLDPLSPEHSTLLQRGRALALTASDGSVTRWRVIFTHPTSNRVAWIPLRKTNTAVPQWVSLDEIVALYEAGALRLDLDDAFRRRAASASTRNPTWMKRWAIVQAVLSHGEYFWLASSVTRSVLALQVGQNLNVPPLAVRRAMTAFYLYGLESEAVAPLFERCGAPGKKRVAGRIRLGRPRFVPPDRLP